MVRRAMTAAVCLVVAAGCSTSTTEPPAPKKERTGIFGKVTQDIGKFDADAKQVVSDQKIHATDPITAPLAAYGPTVEKISILAIDQAVVLFYATEGRYPKDYDEFMEKIVKANNIQLPVLPYGGKYKYDEQSHTLVVVREQPAEKGDAQAK